MLEINIPINCESKEAAQERWNQDIMSGITQSIALLLNEGKKSTNNFRVLSDRFIFARRGRQFAFFQWNSPVLRSFDQSPTLFHFDLEGKEES